MPTINRKVLDLSHHNTVNDLNTVKQAGIVGIIHKATEGTNYVDDKYAGRKAGFLEIGLKWGAYHFFHPGSVEAQVNHFLNTTGIDPDMLYALDWEASSTGTANASDATKFCQLMEQRTGRKCVIYSGNVAKEQIHGVDEYLGSHRLWLAQYGNTPTTQASWDMYWLWQYSDGQNGPQPHGCPGVGGYVDTNSWPGTDDQLIEQWSGTGVAPIPPEPIPVVPTVTITITSDQPVNVVVNKP